MIETLARAIYVSDWGADAEPWDPDLGTKQIYLDRARAVLKALETPTPDMIEAGLRVVQYYAHEGRAMSDEWLVSSIHEAMIRAASVEDET